MLFGKTHLEVRRPSPTTVEFTVTTRPQRTGWTGFFLTTTVICVRVLLAAAAAYGIWIVTTHPTYPIACPIPISVPTTGPFGFLNEDNNNNDHMANQCETLPAWLTLPLCLAAAYASVARVHTSESLLVLRGLGIQTRSTGATYVGELSARAARVWWTVTSPRALWRWTKTAARLVAVVWLRRRRTGGQGKEGEEDKDKDSETIRKLQKQLQQAPPFDYDASSSSSTLFLPTEQLQDLLVNEAFRGFEVRYYLVAVIRSSTTNSSGSSVDDEDHIVVVFPRLLPRLDIVRTVWREARACLYEPDKG